MRTLAIGLPLLVVASLCRAATAWAGPECAVLVALQTSTAQTSQWSAAVTVEVPSCRRSRGRFA